MKDNLKLLLKSLDEEKLNQKFGLVSEIHDSYLIVTNLLTPLNSIVRITSKQNKQITITGIVTKISAEETVVSIFSKPYGITLNDKVTIETEGIRIPQPKELIGKVINPFGELIFEDYNIPKNFSVTNQNEDKYKDSSLSDEQFVTGIKVIDTFTPIVKGQRVSINAGTGVGKTTLVSMLVKNSVSDIKVIALIGERKREVLEFIEKELNGDLSNTIMIVSTSDDVPLMRKYAAISAIKISKELGKENDVLLVMDSLTRASIAQREIGFSNGELPVLGGFPQSSFSFIPELLEEVGCTKNGSVTGFFTVLVDTEEEDDPITETPLANYIRGILDGHILLDRKQAIKGIYPAVNIMSSLSRMTKNISNFTPEWQQNIYKIKESISLIEENQLLIDLGSYQSGMNPELDVAMNNLKLINNFIKQNTEHFSPIEETLTLFNQLSKNYN